ncbi:MAG: bifunctional phosphoribosylaminoimidazolecarboxamide formyltransferase/IMP cyclohydrolase [Fimbriimonadaceae bacterium]|nr:bifunctional phosphoribosylaminoimidazolecarboxamide formyltransferase/IMP cyclohydrolase [Fimbriimonadaceae bacterium]
MERWALLSVTDKSGLVDFARGLVAMGFRLLSTGGTARALRESGFAVRDVAEHTGFPEMLDGRIKTLHPKVHGGLLGVWGRPDHRAAMESVGLEPIALLCVNLYAFERTVRSGAAFEECVEAIDIGGPAMIRAAAKNHETVTVVVDPSDYAEVLGSLDGGASSEHRRRLAAKAFRHTAYYDSMVARYLTDQAGDEFGTETLTLGYRRGAVLRYGENPHQAGALYQDPFGPPGIASAHQIWGKELSYNNLLDGDAAWETACDLPEGSCVVVKHGNPCGAGIGATAGESYRLAREGDPVSAFGGIAAFNGPIDEAAALAMAEKGNFLEVVMGTEFSPRAVEVFQSRSGWGQNVRLLETPRSPACSSLTVRTIRGGWVVQDSDEEPDSEWRVVTRRRPDAEEERALRFLWTIARHVKSNAIVVGTSNQLLGVGAGQMNRVRSVRLALEQAGERAAECALASDAFFPFPDSIEEAARAGIGAIVQPGGSKKDEDVIAAADREGLAMAFTGVRHFRH